MKTLFLSAAALAVIVLTSGCAPHETSARSHYSASTGTERTYDQNDQRFEVRKSDGRRASSPYENRRY